MQPTILAAISIYPIDYAVFLSGTLVVDNRRLAAPEKTLATLTGDDAIVNPRGLVSTDLARDNLDLS